MNNQYSELMIKKLLEENILLKKKLNKISFNKKMLNEKLNIIRTIFTIFENCKITLYESIVLFGEFLEKILNKKVIDNCDLNFYFSNKQNMNSIQKFFNIINNMDCFDFLFNISNVKNIYSVTKNNVTFKVCFYLNDDVTSCNNFFNIQNIILDSIIGLSIKYITKNDDKKFLSNSVLSFLDIMKSTYTNEICINTTDVLQDELYNLIITQERFIKEGYTITNGIKLIDLHEKCAICYEDNMKGILLDCRHSFCISCMKIHLNNNNNSKKCPLCRNIFNIVFE